jgi:hypothetical protein
MQTNIRITKRIQTILSPYGDDAGNAIEEMDMKVDYLENEVKKLKAIADALQVSQKEQTVPAQVYWKKFKETVQESIMDLQRG